MIFALLTHGDWGETLLRSTEGIIGRIPQVVCFPLYPDQSFKAYLNQIQEFVDSVAQEDILFMADLARGSTFNAAGVISNRNNKHAVCGLSMEMLVQADDLRNDYAGEEVVEQLILRCSENIINLRELMRKE